MGWLGTKEGKEKEKEKREMGHRPSLHKIGQKVSLSPLKNKPCDLEHQIAHRINENEKKKKKTCGGIKIPIKGNNLAFTSSNLISIGSKVSKAQIDIVNYKGTYGLFQTKKGGKKVINIMTVSHIVYDFWSFLSFIICCMILF